MVKIKFDLEKIILAVFLVVILYLGPGILFDHKIKHDFPFAYGASDAFQHQVRAEAIKDAGNFRYEAIYISKGLENAIGRYPPVVYHLAVVLSYAAGIEVYDSIYFVVVFFMIIASLVMYFVIKSFNRTIALISLPLSLLVFSTPPSTGFLWGHWPSLLSQAFLILFFWSITKLNMNKSYFLMAVPLSAMALTHMPPFIFGFIFLTLFFGIKILAKKLNKDDVKKIVLSLTVFFILSFYYLVIFYNTWAKAQPYIFSVQPIWEGNPGFYIMGFGLLLIPMLIGLILSFSKLKNLHVALILAFAMLLSGFMNYVGFEVRSFQIRFFWPIYLSVFLGFGLYIIFKLVIKRWNLVYTSILFIILVFLLAGLVKFPLLNQTNIQIIPTIPHINRDTSPGVMNPFHWSALKWLSENTPENARIYFFHGDIYSQDALLRNSKRLHFQIVPGDFVKAIQERKIKRSYLSEMPGDTGGAITARYGFFDFRSLVETIPKDYFKREMDICTFDYFIFDKVSRQEVFAQYNLLLASEIMKKDADVVFDNEVLVILKNNNLGADCIEERDF